MNLAFALFRYFPYGGLERDMLAIARACLERGHRVRVYTRRWQGARPANLEVVELPVRAWTNHGRDLGFARRFRREAVLAPGTVVVGFNKMPGLDLYYAADVCFAEKVRRRGRLYRLTPRARTLLALERAVFERSGSTRVLAISRRESAVYQRHYHTPGERILLLPPGIRRERIRPADPGLRQELRARYGIAPIERVLLLVGSDYRRKGLDRCLRALAQLSPAEREPLRLWVVGQDRAAPFERQARRLGVDRHLRVLGARDDVSELMWAADVLLHPAYSENTGTVLLEGMVAGLPVITSAACGYAHYVRENAMGEVLEAPASAPDLAAALRRVLAVDGDDWRGRGREFAQRADVYSMPERAAEIIERVAGMRP